MPLSLGSDGAGWGRLVSIELASKFQLVLVVRDQRGVDKPCSCFSLDRSLNRSLLPSVSESLLLLLCNGCPSVRPVIVSDYPGQNAVISAGQRGAMIAARVACTRRRGARRSSFTSPPPPPALPPQKAQKAKGIQPWSRRVSIPLPHACEARALPFELRPLD